MGDLIGLVFQPRDRIDDGSPMVPIGSEQVELQLGGFDAELGNRAEEIEELFVAGQEAHRDPFAGRRRGR
jgi:hypothetical protein